MFFDKDHGAVSRATFVGGTDDAPHLPVLLEETLSYLFASQRERLDEQRGDLFVDCTLGLGGHTEAILSSFPEARVIGFDRDMQALEFAKARLARFGSRVQMAHADYRRIREVLGETFGETSVNGVLADLGVSSLQLDTPERGFSFRYDAPLDMRMNASHEGNANLADANDAEDDAEETAGEMLARLPEEEIARIIYEYGEERHSRRIARRIVERREQGNPVQTTTELADLVARAVGNRGASRKRNEPRIHPATRTFQALRIAVNRELENLDKFIETAVDLLEPAGRIVLISFHSLEDRIVKRTLRRLAGRCECDLRRMPQCQCGARRTVEILTARPVTATDAEIVHNPRARSAKLRAAAKL